MKIRIQRTAIGLSAALMFLSPAGARPPAPPGNSLWYYQIGGARPLSLAPTSRTTAMDLAVGGQLANGFNCGKFDPLLSVENTLNQVARGIEDMTNAMTQAANAALAALPALILQRADPGLYDLFQNALVRAEEKMRLNTKSCEQMQGEIDRNINPFNEWVTVSRVNGWKAAMGIGGRQINDVNLAKEAVDRSAADDGVPWYGGRAGGRGQPPINTISGVASAGYNVLLGRAPTDQTPAGMPSNDQPMIAWWRSPSEAAQWASRVLGDEQIRTCEGCPSTVKPGTGLGPVIQEEEQKVADSLTAILNRGREPRLAELDAISAPSVGITPEVIDSLRSLPAQDREVLAGRITSEIATARAVEEALYMRRILIAGRDTPETSVTGPAVASVERRLALIDREIENVLYERRIRTEITGIGAETALKLRRSLANKSVQDNPQAQKTQNPVSSDPLRK